MTLVAYKNTGKKTRHIGGSMVAPGETIMVDTRRVPGFVGITPGQAPEPPKAPDNAAVIEQLLNHSIADLKEVLPSLSVPELDQLEAGEREKDKPRQGALTAITEDRLRRAAAENDPLSDQQLDAYVALLAEMDDAELAEQDGHGDESVQAAIDAERLKREIAVFKTEFAAFDVSDLEELKGTYAEQPEYLEAIDALIADKAGA